MSKTSTLDKTLRNAEDECLQPVVPGEVARWIGVVEPALARVDEAWEAADPARADSYEDILADDPGLATRAEGLRQDRNELGGRLDELRRRARELLATTREDPTASEEPFEEARDFRREALHRIVEARAHGAEVDTWLAEAMRRDRGVAD